MLVPILAGLAGLACMSNPRRRSKRRRRNPGKDPWGQPYKRVLEAEIALEAMNEKHSNPRRRGKRSRVSPSTAAGRLAWWRWHHNPPQRFTGTRLEKMVADYNRFHQLTDATGKFIVDFQYGMVAVRWQMAGETSVMDVTGLGTPRQVYDKWVDAVDYTLKRQREIGGYKPSAKTNPRRRRRARRNRR